MKFKLSAKKKSANGLIYNVHIFIKDMNAQKRQSLGELRQSDRETTEHQFQHSMLYFRNDINNTAAYILKTF